MSMVGDPALVGPGTGRPERHAARQGCFCLPDRKSLGGGVARLPGFGVGELRNHWPKVFRRRPHPHLPRHLLFRVLAYQLQVDHLGDLDGESRRLLDRSGSPEKVGQHAAAFGRRAAELHPGTMLAREWNGQMQRVAVLTDGFAWNGNTYPSLSKVAGAITGTRCSRPKFFGMRDKPPKGSSP